MVPRPTRALFPLDYQAHTVVGELVDEDVTALVACCGHIMPTAASLDTVPHGALCARCVRVLVPLDLGGWAARPDPAGRRSSTPTS